MDKAGREFAGGTNNKSKKLDCTNVGYSKKVFEMTSLNLHQLVP